MHAPSTCGSVTGHGKAKRADWGTLQHAVEARDKVRSGRGRMRVEVLRQGDGERRIECQGAVFMGRGGCRIPGTRELSWISAG